jgi:hypothetical protein
MKRMAMAVLAAAVVVAATAGSGTESKWTVTNGGKSVASVTLLTSSSGSRGEWKAGGGTAPVIFLASKGQTWVRQTGGDVEIASYKGGEEKTIVPALLRIDANGTKTMKVAAGSTTNTLTRTSLSTSNADASNFAVRPKKGASSTISRLSGDLFGQSSSGVSATAGGRGVGNSGMKLKDGGDYDAVAALEKRDTTWKASLDQALQEFQKDGKVGKERP